MSKKNKNANDYQPEQSPRRVRVGFTMVNPLGHPAPVARPSSQIQLTPIVQSINMMPYSNQQQPVLSDMDDELDEDYDF